MPRLCWPISFAVGLARHAPWMSRKAERWIAGCAVAVLLPTGAYAACTNWDVSGKLSISQTAGDDLELRLEQDGNTLKGRTSIRWEGATKTAHFGGTIDGSSISFSITGSPPVFAQIFSGSIDDEGFIGGEVANQILEDGALRVDDTGEWSGNRKAKCLLSLGRVTIPPGTTPPEICAAAQSARKRGSPAAPGLERQCNELQAAQGSSGGQLPDLAMTGISGPGSLQAGLSGTFTIEFKNKGNTGATVDLTILFVGKLDQTGRIVAGAGFYCDPQSSPSPKVNTVLHCSGGQLGAGEATSIVVQGRGYDAGTGIVSVSLNNSRSVEESNYGNNLGEFDVAIN